MTEDGDHPPLLDGWRERLTELAREYHDASNYETGDGCDPERMCEVRETVEQWADPARIVGEGEGRLVAHLPDSAFDAFHVSDGYVVKLPLSGEPYGDPDVRGLAQNGHERYVWEETESEYLLPVTHHHPEDWWLVMPLGTPVGAEPDGFEEWAEGAEAALDGMIARREVTPRNAVKHDFEFRLCDYGYPPER